MIDDSKVPLHAHEEPRTAEEAEQNSDDAEDAGATFQRSEGEIQERVGGGEEALQVRDKLLLCRRVQAANGKADDGDDGDQHRQDRGDEVKGKRRCEAHHPVVVTFGKEIQQGFRTLFGGPLDSRSAVLFCPSCHGCFLLRLLHFDTRQSTLSFHKGNGMSANASRAVEVRSGVRIEVFTVVYERYQEGCQSFDSVAANW